MSKSILESEMDAAVACGLLHSISLNVISEPMEGGYGPLQASQETLSQQVLNVKKSSSHLTSTHRQNSQCSFITSSMWVRWSVGKT